jgi:signal transduction histidine kinase
LVKSTVEDFVEIGSKLSINSSAEIRLNARPHALRRCLTNLIDNALKYGVVEVAITIEVLPDEVCILVLDRGPGIPIDEIEKVFEPFYRLESSRSRDTGGTGLGLAIARQIAVAHGGDVTLINRSEGGLESRLHLPKQDGRPCISQPKATEQ